MRQRNDGTHDYVWDECLGPPNHLLVASIVLDQVETKSIFERAAWRTLIIPRCLFVSG